MVSERTKWLKELRDRETLEGRSAGGFVMDSMKTTLPFFGDVPSLTQKK